MKARSSVQAKATPKAKAKPSGEGKEGTALPVALGGLSRAMHSSASRVLDSIVKVIDGMTKEVGKSMDDINKQAGKRIRELRISKGFSQEGLADSSGLHRSHMGEIERGELNVTLKTLERVSFALKVPVVDFLKGTGRRGGRL